MDTYYASRLSVRIFIKIETAWSSPNPTGLTEKMNSHIFFLNQKKSENIRKWQITTRLFIRTSLSLNNFFMLNKYGNTYQHGLAFIADKKLKVT